VDPIVKSNDKKQELSQKQGKINFISQNFVSTERILIILHLWLLNESKMDIQAISS
jgi:hypothetical protein